MIPGMSEVTVILERAAIGDSKAAEDLLPLVYQELRKMAAAKMAGESPGHTLQPTALVHEAWLRLGITGDRSWKNRAHFFGAAAEAMRRILVESARRKARWKRGGGIAIEELDESKIEIAAPAEEIIEVNDALEALAAQDEVAAQVVKLRYFVGLPLPKVAEVLQISPRTADRLWAFARVKLKRAIREKQG
jgi:RNA polymerase sigma factor (TIGR02999 family)